MKQRTSWMRPEAKSEDLLYTATRGKDSSGHYLAVFTYPKGKHVGQVSVASSSGLCSDSKGDIFVTQGSNTGGDSQIVEYAHGGTQPIATLSDPYNGAFGCSVDPATGNLAVANSGGIARTGNVLVYPKASGTPTAYQFLYAPFFCAYDGSGDLFVLSELLGRHIMHPLDELVEGANQFRSLKMQKRVPYPMGVQWDGTYLVFGLGTNDVNLGRLHRYTIQGDRAIFENGIKLGVFANSFLIQGSTVMVSGGGYNNIWLLTYPGSARKKYLKVNGPYGIAISVAPSK